MLYGMHRTRGKRMMRGMHLGLQVAALVVCGERVGSCICMRNGPMTTITESAARAHRTTTWDDREFSVDSRRMPVHSS